MATSFYSLLSNNKVVIPIIQRDYAQGRTNNKVTKIRELFLKAIFEVLSDDSVPLELDFVYGYMNGNNNQAINNQSKFTPLDGQQRLTTLFLLHWYIAVKEDRIGEAQKFLSNFSYETRHDSRIFCENLIKFVPDEIDTPIRDTIINQSWFFVSWEKDPTISSMLTMLNAIQQKVSQFNLDEADIWSLLISDPPKIGFHLLQMDKLGLPDDLYIKMNSRGKELTEFEYFKSQFSELLEDQYKEKFKYNIDQDWSDLFWDLYKSEDQTDIAKLVDNAFIRFLNYITDILIFKSDLELNQAQDYLEIYKIVYKEDENVQFLFSSLDCLYAVYSIDSTFFEDIFYFDQAHFDKNKVRLFFQNPKLDLFKKCADNYNTTEHINPFSIGEQLMLFACIIHLQNDSKDFNSQIRKIRNLITNSEDTVRKEKMPNLIASVESIVKNNTVIPSSEFNSKQIEEESRKEEFLKNHPELIESLFKLEDHKLLQGCLAVFELNNHFPDYSNAFLNLFHPQCSYDILSKALLTFGDYSQKYGWRKRFGNRNDSVWRELFTPSNRRGDFENTKNVLQKLIDKKISDSVLSLENLIDQYLIDVESQTVRTFEWRYYYIKYSGFRMNEDGYYYWPNPAQPYNCMMMRRSTLGGYHWSPFIFELKEPDNEHLSLDSYGAPLLITKDYETIQITNLNNGYKIDAEDNSKILKGLEDKGLVTAEGFCEVKQNLQGLDEEDRVEKGKMLIAEIINF